MEEAERRKKGNPMANCCILLIVKKVTNISLLIRIKILRTLTFNIITKRRWKKEKEREPKTRLAEAGNGTATS
jgi:hypothetical protein